MRHSPRHQRAKRAAEQRSGRRDQRALPQKDRADIDPAVTHRTQNGDLLYFRQHRHRQHIENTETGEQDDKRNGDRDGHSQGKEKLQCAFLAVLPTCCAMLEEFFETFGQSGRTIRIAQFVNDHRRAGRLLQKGLRDPGMCINPGGINRSDPRARNCGNSETPVLPIWREQLHRVADASLKHFCQTRTDNDRARIVSKVVEVAVNQLVEKIRRLRMQSRIDAVKIDSRIFKSRASADCSTQNRRTRNHIGELSAYPHDFVRVGDAFKIQAAPHRSVRTFRRNHQRLVARTETRSDNQRAVAADGRINEVAREALGLRLRADKNRHTENDAAEAQK